ncbi:uncharacterized protein LOC125195583 [Salvia hispanica]|uniref:uncharacterized protein LOC125195583 n=1 Tax=Salvia hispanica TaxID=49212 RepID=UPI00200971DF|nr:uncharacterized protein LOC125195583 [Salvia hispanica]
MTAILILEKVFQTRAGHSRADQFYASYPAGTELLTDTGKLYKAALGNCFEIEEWGPIEWSILAKHFERQGKSPYAYHSMVLCIFRVATGWERLAEGWQCLRYDRYR